MNSELSHLLAKQLAADAHRAGEHARLAHEFQATRQPTPDSRDCPVTIRWSTPDDVAAIQKISELDSRRAPSEPSLIAELGAEMVAVLCIETGDVAANPFRHTAHAVTLLRVRAKQLTTDPRSVRRSLRRPRLARPVVDPR